jgi:hypothetical protein
VLAHQLEEGAAILAALAGRLGEVVCWFGVNVTEVVESYRGGNVEGRESCGPLVELGTANAASFARGVELGIPLGPDDGTTRGEEVGWVM